MKSPNKITVEFNEKVGRWIARYERDGVINEYLLTDWAVNRFDAQPKVVDEVEELFALNFLFYYSAVQAQKAGKPAESGTVAA